MKNNPRPYVLAETNWKTVREENYTVAILPWGATEAHNYHMPYGTDNILAENAALASAEIAWTQGAKVIVLPTIPFGVNTGQIDVDLCLNMNPSTQMAVLKDLVQVMEANGIRKLVIVNGHGGNNFKQMIRELSIIHLLPKLVAGRQGFRLFSRTRGPCRGIGNRRSNAFNPKFGIALE